MFLYGSNLVEIEASHDARQFAFGLRCRYESAAYRCSAYHTLEDFENERMLEIVNKLRQLYNNSLVLFRELPLTQDEDTGVLLSSDSFTKLHDSLPDTNECAGIFFLAGFCIANLKPDIQESSMGLIYFVRNKPEGILTYALDASRTFFFDPSQHPSCIANLN